MEVLCFADTLLHIYINDLLLILYNMQPPSYF